MRCLTFILFFLLLNTFLSAQAFVDPDNEWVVTTCVFNLSTGQTNCQSNRVWFSDSTVLIDNKDYFVLESDLGTDFRPIVPVGSFYREENGKVFIKEQTNSNELLVFDFSLQVGDTIEVYGTNLSVGQVDSVELKTGGFRKRLKMLGMGQSINDEGFYWIQGVGKEDLPFLPFIGSQDVTNELHCFLTDNVLELSFDGIRHFGSCELLSNDNDIASKPALSVYPNPTIDQLNVDGLSSSFESIKIHSIQGDLIKTIHRMPQGYISTDDLNAGAYLITIDNGDGIRTSKKFIKI